jgi:hypothetical protein
MVSIIESCRRAPERTYWRAAVLGGIVALIQVFVRGFATHDHLARPPLWGEVMPSGGCCFARERKSTRMVARIVALRGTSANEASATLAQSE